MLSSKIQRVENPEVLCDEFAHEDSSEIKKVIDRY